MALLGIVVVGGGGGSNFPTKGRGFAGVPLISP